MNKSIEISAHTTQASPLNLDQSFDKIVQRDSLSLSSPEFSNLNHEAIKQKVSEIISSWKQTRIQTEFDSELINQLSSELKSPEMPQGHKNKSRIGSKTIEIYECGDDDYLDFMKKVESIKGNQKDIMKIRDFKTRKVEYEKLMQMKPSLQKAIELIDWMKSSDSDLYDQKIKIFQGMIQESQVWSENIRNYLNKYLIDDEIKIEASQIKEITRGLSTIKEKTNHLILKDEELDKKIFIFEWKFQAALFMNSDPQSQSDIKYWRDLLNRAQESKHKEILESERYREICRQVVKYARLICQVKEIQDQEKFLVKLGNNNRKDIEAMGKCFRDQESVKEILKKLIECKVFTLREELFLQRILDQAKKIMTEYEEIKNSPTYIPTEKFQSIVKQFQKLPMKLPQEIEEQIMTERRINELIQAVVTKPSFDIAKKISEEYESCSLYISKAQDISRAYQQVEILKTIENAFEHRRDISYKEICKLEKQVDDFPLDLGPRYILAKIQIWLVQIALLRSWKENATMPEKPIPFQKLYEFLNKGNDYIDDIPKEMFEIWRSSLRFLKDLIGNMEDFVARINHLEDPRKENCSFSHFIEIELEATAAQRKILEPSSLLKKRRELSPFLETPVVEGQDESLVKKFKTQESFLRIERGVNQEEINEKERVTWGIRAKAIYDILELVKKLKGEDLQDAREAVRELETKIFRECNWNKRAYEKKIQVFCITLVELQNYPCLQKKILKQKLDYEEIQKCMKSSIPQLELEEKMRQENEDRKNDSFNDENKMPKSSLNFENHQGKPEEKGMGDKKNDLAEQPRKTIDSIKQV